MRVAVIVSEFPVLSETFVVGQILGLLERGHDVTIYADELGSRDDAPRDVARHALLARARAPLHLSRRARSAGGLLEVLARAMRGLHPRRLAAYGRAARYGTAHVLASFRYHAAAGFRQEAYDVLHCHFAPNGVKAAALRDAGVLTGKLAVTFHGFDLSADLAASAGNLRRLLRTADVCLPVSERWRERLIEIGAEPSRTRVHRMGVDLHRLQPRERTPRAGPLRVVSVARLVEKKGIEYGIRAVAAAGGDVQYTVVGDGPLRPELEALSAALGAADRVRLIGRRDPDDVLEILASADAVLVPSVTAADGDQEGVPMVLMEAMALAVPVVATHHSGIPELLRDGTEGFLVHERDVAGLAAALRRLAGDVELRTRLGAAGRRRAEEMCDLDRQNEQLVSIFDVLSAQA